jgi:hypothetical protein
MSNRTIIEINHDYWHKIEADGDGFAQLVVDFTRACDPGIAAALRDRFGAAVLGTVHHSDKIAISFNKLT